MGKVWGVLLLLVGSTGLVGASPARAQQLPQPPPPLTAPPKTSGAGGVMPVAEVVVELSKQRLSAFDGEHRLLYRRLVSTGVPASPTPTGSFRVAARYASTPMTGRDYHLAAVPHVLCLEGDGLPPDAICIHPAPWQEQAGEPFGVRRSHGCVRTSSATARWLFERTPVGTPVLIRP